VTAIRIYRLLLVLGLALASLLIATSVALAQAAGVTPGSAPPGTEITVFGDGFGPGEEITVSFGGIEVVTFADDNGSFTVSLTIDDLMPPGMHPLDVEGDQGNFFSFEYLVEEPPPPTTQPPATTTTAASATSEAATTTENPQQRPRPRPRQSLMPRFPPRRSPTTPAFRFLKAAAYRGGSSCWRYFSPSS